MVYVYIQKTNLDLEFICANQKLHRILVMLDKTSKLPAMNDMHLKKAFQLRNQLFPKRFDPEDI